MPSKVWIIVAIAAFFAMGVGIVSATPDTIIQGTVTFEPDFSDDSAPYSGEFMILITSIIQKPEYATNVNIGNYYKIYYIYPSGHPDVRYNDCVEVGGNWDGDLYCAPYFDNTHYIKECQSSPGPGPEPTNLPDLEISIKGPTCANPGQSITIIDTIKNTGNAPVSSSFVIRYLLSVDSKSDASDIELGTRTISSMGSGGSSNSKSVTLTIPATIPAGTYYILAQVDSSSAVKESNEGNNWYTGLKIQIPCPVTITPTTTTTATPMCTPPPCKPGEPLICPTGQSCSGGCGLVCAVPPTTTPGQQTCFYFNSGLEGWQRTGVLIPWISSLDEQIKWLDSYGGVTGVVRMDACDCHGGWSGIWKSIAIPSNANSITINFVKEDDAGDGGYRIFLRPSTYEWGDFLKEGVINQGKSTVTVNIPDKWKGKTATLQVECVGAGTIAPSDWACGGKCWFEYVGVDSVCINTTSTPPVAQPDLIINSLTGLPTCADPGKSIVITDSVKNIGIADASAFSVAYYLSSDNTYSSNSDYYLGERSISSLTAGSTNSQTVSIPLNIPAGSYYLVAYTDSSNIVSESNEGNNWVSSNSKIQIPCTQSYIITSTAGSGGSISPSGQVSVSAGASKTFSITPNTGYQIIDVKVDGQSMGQISTYTFSNVHANHSISVLFASTPPDIGEVYINVVRVSSGADNTAILVLGRDDVFKEVTVEKGKTVRIAATCYNLFRDQSVRSWDASLGIYDAATGNPVSTPLTVPAQSGESNSEIYEYITTSTREFEVLVYVKEKPEIKDVKRVKIIVSDPNPADCKCPIACAPPGPCPICIPGQDSNNDGWCDTYIPEGEPSCYRKTSDVPSKYPILQGKVLSGLNQWRQVNQDSFTGAFRVEATAIYLPPGSSGGPAIKIGDTVYVILTLASPDPPIVSVGGCCELVGPISTVDGIVLNCNQVDDDYTRYSAYMNCNSPYPPPKGWVPWGGTVDPCKSDPTPGPDPNPPVVTKLPDLVISLTGPTCANPGQSITITDTIKNVGNASITSSFVSRYLLSVDSKSDASDIELGARSIASIGSVGSSNSKSVTLTIPANTTAGTYYILAQVDSTYAVKESNEGNNWYTGLKIQIPCNSPDPGNVFVNVVRITSVNDGTTLLLLDKEDTYGEVTVSQGTTVRIAATCYNLFRDQSVPSWDATLGIYDSQTGNPVSTPLNIPAQSGESNSEIYEFVATETREFDVLVYVNEKPDVRDVKKVKIFVKVGPQPGNCPTIVEGTITDVGPYLINENSGMHKKYEFKIKVTKVVNLSNCIYPPPSVNVGEIITITYEYQNMWVDCAQDSECYHPPWGVDVEIGKCYKVAYAPETGGKGTCSQISNSLHEVEEIICSSPTPTDSDYSIFRGRVVNLYPFEINLGQGSIRHIIFNYDLEVLEIIQQGKATAVRKGDVVQVHYDGSINDDTSYYQDPPPFDNLPQYKGTCVEMKGTIQDYFINCFPYVDSNAYTRFPSFGEFECPEVPTPPSDQCLKLEQTPLSERQKTWLLNDLALDVKTQPGCGKSPLRTNVKITNNKAIFYDILIVQPDGKVLGCSNCPDNIQDCLNCRFVAPKSQFREVGTGNDYIVQFDTTTNKKIEIYASRDSIPARVANTLDIFFLAVLDKHIPLEDSIDEIFLGVWDDWSATEPQLIYDIENGKLESAFFYLVKYYADEDEGFNRINKLTTILMQNGVIDSADIVKIDQGVQALKLGIKLFNVGSAFVDTFTAPVNDEIEVWTVPIPCTNCQSQLPDSAVIPTQAPSGTTGTLTVSSTPTGAMVYVDGVYKGVTPVTIPSISSGQHQLKVTKSGYQDYSTAVNIPAGKTASVPIVLKIGSSTTVPTTVPTTIPTTVPTQAPSGTTGTLTVSSTPTGAMVYVDGVYKGVTPATIPGISSGQHQLKVTKSGYQDYSTAVNIPAGKTASIPILLKIGSSNTIPTTVPTTVPTTAPTQAPSGTTGTLTVSSTPTGAMVYVDGVYKGVTPVAIPSISSGQHQLKVTKSGYQDYSTAVNIPAGKTASVPIILKVGSSTTVPTTIPTTTPTTAPTQAPSGTTGALSVTSTPTGAMVYVDGVYKGVTPATIPGISSGQHQLKVTKSGYQDYSTAVNIPAGKTASVPVILKVGASTTVPTTIPTTTPTTAPTQAPSGTTGALSVTSTPTGAMVYVDGVYKGVTPATIPGISSGLHQIKVTKSGYQDYSTAVNIPAGKTASVPVILKVGASTTVLTTIPTTTPTTAPTQAPSGTTGALSVTSTPTGAMVYVDGVLKGFSPCTLSNVALGSHQIQLKKFGYDTYSITAIVNNEATTSVSATLISNSRSLNIPTIGILQSLI